MFVIAIHERLIVIITVTYTEPRNVCDCKHECIVSFYLIFMEFLQKSLSDMPLKLLVKKFWDIVRL